MQSIYTTGIILFLLFTGISLFGQNAMDAAAVQVDSLSEGAQLFAAAEGLQEEEKFEEAVQKFDEALLFFLEKRDTAMFEKCSHRIHKICFGKRLTTYADFYQQKIELCVASFGENSVQKGIWYAYLGQLIMYEQYALAEEYFYKALELVTGENGRHQIVVDCLTNLSYVQSKLNNIEKKIETGQRTIDTLFAFYEKNYIEEKEFDLGLCIAYHNLAIINKNLGKYEEAIANYHLALERVLKYPEPRMIGMVYYNTGFAYLNKKAPLKAEEYLNNALFHFRQLYGEKHDLTASTYNLLGIVHHNLHNFPEALNYFKLSATIHEELLGMDNHQVAMAFENMASCHEELKEFDQAEAYFQRAVSILENVFPNPSPQKIGSYINLGTFWMDQNMKLDSAQIFFEKAIADGKAIYGKRHLYVSSSYRNIGDIYVKRKKDREAMAYYQKALMANTYQFAGLESTENPAVDDFVDEHIGITTLRSKAIALFNQWKVDKNNSSAVEKIDDCLKLANKLMDKLTKKNGGESLRDLVYFADIKRTESTALNIYFELFQHNKQAAFLESYYFWMEKLKAQNLLLIAQESAARSFVKIDSALVAKEKHYAQKIEDLRQEVFTNIEAGDSLKASEIQNNALFHIRRAQDAFIADLEKKHPAYHQLKYDYQPISIENLQQVLDKKTLFYTLSFDENKMFGAVFSKQKQELFKTDLPTDLNKKITTFNRLLRSHNLLRADRRRKFINLSHELYNQFIKPIEHLLEGKERLVIVGEGVTHYLPFEALLKSKEDKPWQELDFLIKDHEISYHYSGTLFARAQEQKTDFNNELLAFAPVFSENDSTLSTLRAGGLVMADTTFRSVEGDNFTPLPYSEKEVKNIQQLFPKSANTNLLLNQSANERNLKAALEKNHRFVHIASHSFANIDYPKFSGIACATDSTSTTDDGILYVGEVYNLAVNSDLVVLSSCESGVGKLLGGEGMLGLNRSFVYAGVPNVIFSLWKVYDENTGELMTEFYKNALQGQSYAKALRAAKLKMLANQETAAPDIWGAFLLVGR